MSTTEGWLEVMYAGVDARGIDMQPKRNNSEGWVFFFIFFIIVGNFFVLNLFVGVVIDNFKQMKDELGGYALLTESQRRFLATQQMMLRFKPRKVVVPPEQQWRMSFFNLVQRSSFEVLINTCIIVNAVFMAAQFFGQPHELTVTLEVMNRVFAALFTVEAVLKLLGLGRQYFKDNWNVFDFSTTIGSLVGIVLTITTSSNVGSIATVVRTFRIARLLRLVRSWHGLRKLITTLLITLPALSNIAGLLFLLYFIYAIMGVQIFAKVKYGESLNHHAHFRDFGTALITLVRSSTGEAWNDIMYDLSDDTACTTDPSYNDNMCGFNDFEGCTPLDGCGSPAAYPFFFSFMLLVSFVMLNLFIGVILDTMSELSSADRVHMAEEDFQLFVSEWSKCDPDATYCIPVSQLEDILRALPPPLGFKQESGEQSPSRMEVQRHIRNLGIVTYSTDGAKNVVHFVEVSRALARRACELKDNVRDLEAVDDMPVGGSVSRQWQRIRKSRSRNLNQGYSLMEYYAAITIHTAYTTFAFQRVLRRKRRESMAFAGSDSVADREFLSVAGTEVADAGKAVAEDEVKAE